MRCALYCHKDTPEEYPDFLEVFRSMDENARLLLATTEQAWEDAHEAEESVPAKSAVKDMIEEHGGERDWWACIHLGDPRVLGERSVVIWEVEMEDAPCLPR